jgi:hypothetical protein
MPGAKALPIPLMTEHAWASWELDGEAYDAVVLAASLRNRSLAAAASRAGRHSHGAAARSDRHRLLRSPAPAASPMMASLRREGPAQFVVDRGVLGDPGTACLVHQCAEAWVAAGRTSTLEAVRAQATAALALLQSPLETIVGLVSEKGRPFSAHRPAERPPMEIAQACSQRVILDGTVPRHSRGRVRSGLAAARAC